MALFESHHNRIAHNRMVGNADVGLEVVGSDHNHILHNRLRRHPLDGIVIDGRFNEIARNRVIRNGGGILITKVENFGPIVGNVVRRNFVRGSRRGGLGVDPVARRTLLRRNLVVGSARSCAGSYARVLELFEAYRVEIDEVIYADEGGVVDVVRDGGRVKGTDAEGPAAVLDF